MLVSLVWVSALLVHREVPAGNSHHHDSVSFCLAVCRVTAVQPRGLFGCSRFRRPYFNTALLTPHSRNTPMVKPHFCGLSERQKVSCNHRAPRLTSRCSLHMIVNTSACVRGGFFCPAVSHMRLADGGTS